MTDYQTKQKRRNTIVGLFVMGAFVAFGIFLWWFRELPLLISRLDSFQVLVYFPEVPGVQKDTPVHYCGYQVGRVMKVAPPQVYEEKHKVGVSIAIDKDFIDIPDDVQFVVMKRGLGSSYIDIRDLSPGEPSGYLEGDMTLIGSVSMASDFFPPEVQAAMPNLVEAVSNLTENVNNVIGDEENQANIKKTLGNIESAAAQLEDTLESVEQLSGQGIKSMQGLSDNIDRISEVLEATLSETRQVMAKIESGDGTAGKLVNDGRLYENLIESSQELKMLLEQLKQWADQIQQEGVKVKTKVF